MYGKNEENSELLSEAMDVLSDMDELQIRQCLAMMKAMKRKIQIIRNDFVLNLFFTISNLLSSVLDILNQFIYSFV